MIVADVVDVIVVAVAVVVVVVDVVVVVELAVTGRHDINHRSRDLLRVSLNDFENKNFKVVLNKSRDLWLISCLPVTASSTTTTTSAATTTTVTADRNNDHIDNVGNDHIDQW